MTTPWKFAAFSGYGIEIEYMIVSEETLDVAPVADRLLAAVGGAEEMDVPRGEAAWSNELALHVIEIKTAGPTSDLPRARALFREQVGEINALLQPLGARLMPGGMHPWMDPRSETHLWPHQNDEIYQAFDRIFDCRGHGWSNLQSTHINFPFSSEEEFVRVHAACRFVLPLLPALAASSPFWEGARGPALDTRLMAYRTNCARVPSVTGLVVPEPMGSIAQYQALLAGIYADLAPFDQEGILAEEWVNARGAITRFDRGAVEIRVLDTQECPEQDICIVYFVTELVRALADGHYGSVERFNALSTERLLSFLEAAAASGGRAAFGGGEYAGLLGSRAETASELLAELVTRHVPTGSPFHSGARLIVEQGNLAERLCLRLPTVHRDGLCVLYGELCECLRTGEPFAP